MLDERDDLNDKGWSSYSRLVLSEIKRLDTEVRELWKKTNDGIVSLEVLKAKAALMGGLVGLVAGFISTLIVGLLKLLFDYLMKKGI